MSNMSYYFSDAYRHAVCFLLTVSVLISFLENSRGLTNTWKVTAVDSYVTDTTLANSPETVSSPRQFSLKLSRDRSVSL